MRRIPVLLATLSIACPSFIYAAALGTNTQEAIPAQVQQIISVDYRELQNSPMAEQMHDKILPPNLKEFENALKGVGIDPKQDIDHLTFASFRQKNQLMFVGVAEGQFALKQVITKLRAKKIKPQKYQGEFMYPMGSGFEMSLLDDGTLLFGDAQAMRASLDAFTGNTPSLPTNNEITDNMPDVDSSPVWSVLDTQGTQEMLRSALGDAAKLADYETLKTRLKASRYQMNFDHGMKFDLGIVTSDSFTATSLSTILKAGMLYKKMQADAAEKELFDRMSVDSDGDLLQLHFKADDQQFQSLINSQLFASVAR